MTVPQERAGGSKEIQGYRMEWRHTMGYGRIIIWIALQEE